MKKKIALVLAGLMTIGLMGCGGGGATENTPADPNKTDANSGEQAQSGELDELIEAAKAEGELVVYGSCEEEYLAAACEHFEELYGIKVQYQRLSTGEVQSKIEEENGNPSGDVWFGGTRIEWNKNSYFHV